MCSNPPFYVPNLQVAILFQFDPAFTRYQALGASRYEHFKPSGKSIVNALLFFVIPMTVTGVLVYRSRAKAEASYRAGEVAYKDRRFRFA